MLNTYLQPRYQRAILDPSIAIFSRICSPNQLTLLACLLGIAVIPTLLLTTPLLATACLLISGYFDTLDGYLARTYNQSNNLGAALDIIADRIVEFSAVFALFAVDPSHRSCLVVLMLGSMLLCVTSFLVVGVFTQNNSKKSFYYSPGLMERAEAFVFFILMIWLPDYFIELAILFTSLTLWTAFLRIKQFAKQTHLNEK